VTAYPGFDVVAKTELEKGAERLGLVTQSDGTRRLPCPEGCEAGARPHLHGIRGPIPNPDMPPGRGILLEELPKGAPSKGPCWFAKCPFLIEEHHAEAHGPSYLGYRAPGGAHLCFVWDPEPLHYVTRKEQERIRSERAAELEKDRGEHPPVRYPDGRALPYETWRAVVLAEWADFKKAHPQG
jgi:hypothetical protein